MTKDRKPTRTDLLDELSSIQSLLGDAAHDVDQPLLEDEIPVLPPDDADGDAHTQIPLLGADTPRSTGDPLRKALSERENPFLPKSAGAAKPQPTLTGSKAIEALIAQRAASAPHAPAASPASPAAPAALSDSQIHALVDEVLAEWLPKIERDLRNRLIDALKNRS
ncbi:MAG: hypothetical protein KDH99_03875 [Alcanivoracaceae bacterium]|nr:hypothetical protein [Alcanivoracaceae bacterium]